FCPQFRPELSVHKKCRGELRVAKHAPRRIVLLREGMNFGELAGGQECAANAACLFIAKQGHRNDKAEIAADSEQFGGTGDENAPSAATIAKFGKIKAQPPAHAPQNPVRRYET